MDTENRPEPNPRDAPPRPALGRAAVVAPHRLATAAGAAILRRGGNAVDAAIATNAALSVVSAYVCGLGGDAFWLIWSEAASAEVALNGSGRAGAAADPARLRAMGLDELPTRGPLTITVPGAVRSWADAHARFGRLPFRTLMEPAIALAESGFPADRAWVSSIAATDRALAAELGAAAAGWRQTFAPDGMPHEGELVRLPALADTFRRLADAGPADFYEGLLSERQAAALSAAGALVSGADLREHTSTWGEPIASVYRGVTVTTHPPNSSGVVGLELLNILECFDPPAREEFGYAGPDLRWVHLTLEAAVLALADRDATLTDPEARNVPVRDLLDKGYARRLAASIDPGRAGVARRTGNRIGGGTVYLATVDADGNAVSLIQSNYRGFGSGIVDPATGVAYQNRGSYFSLDPAHPNVLAPRKRTLHTLLPAMLFRDERPWVVCGSMGGDAQPIVLGQLVSGLVDGRLDVGIGVSAPRVSAEAARHFGPRDRVVAEPRFRPGLLDGLEAMGHRVERVAAFDSALGHCHAIELLDGGPAASGGVAAATDPRSQGEPAVL